MMPISHLFLAMLVVVIWGVNFIFVKFALDEMHPFLLCTLRFFLASVPAVFFIRPPAIPFKMIVLYGFFAFVLQFSFLFLSMHVGMPAGMASLLLQVQVFFSMFYAACFYAELPSILQILGALISFSGIMVVMLYIDSTISILGFVLIMASAATWGLGNMIVKQFKKINMIALVVWGSFVAIFPTLLFSLLFEGVSSISHTYYHMTWLGIVSLLYIVVASTWVGYGLWNWLLSQHSVSQIVPFTLLVPIVGMLSAVLMINEPLHLWKIAAGFLVIGGLSINLFGAHLFELKNRVLSYTRRHE